MHRSLRKKKILVTGATSGLGQEIARQLATNCEAIVYATGRNQKALASLRNELGENVHIRQADLASAEELHSLFGWVVENEIEIVVLNAAVNHYGEAINQTIPSLRLLLETNIQSVTELALRFGRSCIERKLGGQIVLVSSVAGFGPVPYQAVYAASKAYLTSLGLALNMELAPSGVDVTVYTPGFMATKMLESTGLATNLKLSLLGTHSVSTAAAKAITSIARRKRLATPGFRNRLIALFLAIIPSGVALRVTKFIYAR